MTLITVSAPAAISDAGPTAAWSRRVLWLDHLVHIPRYRAAGWALTVGPLW
ncbi:MAG: hypothetical protein ACLP5E_16110 [Streptosporangiaceae bacterium]